MKAPSPTVAIAESLSPRDLYDERQEGLAIAEILHLAGIEATRKVVFGICELRKAIRAAAKADVLVFHLSCHVDENGICLLDGTKLDWQELANELKLYAKPNHAVVLSACKAGVWGITKHMPKIEKRIGWVFGPEDDIPFTDACITWAILYREIVTNGLTKDGIKDVVDQINAMMQGKLVYRRLTDKGKYNRYPPSKDQARNASR